MDRDSLKQRSLGVLMALTRKYEELDAIDKYHSYIDTVLKGSLGNEEHEIHK